MADFKAGQIVGRASYNCDILFRIKQINGDTAELTGEDMRLLADAPVSDLVPIKDEERKRRAEKYKNQEESCYQLFRQDRKLIREKSEYEVTSGYTKKSSILKCPEKCFIWMETHYI